MNECGNGWVDGKMNGRVAEWVDDLVNEWVNEWVNGSVDGKVNEWVDDWVKEPVNEWGMSEWTSVWMSGHIG